MTDVPHQGSPEHAMWAEFGRRRNSITPSRFDRAYQRGWRTDKKRSPGAEPGLKVRAAEGSGRLEPIENLVGPEALQAVQSLVEDAELVGVDTANLFHRPHVLVVERVDDVTHFAALVGELDAYRAPVDARTLMVEESHLHQLLEIVGDVGAKIIAACAQFARGQLLVADIVEKQRLDRIDVGAATAVEFVLDNVE